MITMPSRPPWRTRVNSFLLPEYYREGKNYFRIGIGCTGGQHRSVLVAEELASALAEERIPNILVSVSHRDMHTATLL